MKLLAELQRQVAGMGTLRHAWFTSFNTDIEFVETYVLPATLGANTPRKRLDYEQLQQELTDKGVDFRVFCDPRFLEIHRIKRSCIPVHGIRPVRAPDRWFSEASLFHPKVIYLVSRHQPSVGGGEFDRAEDVTGVGRKMMGWRNTSSHSAPKKPNYCEAWWAKESMQRKKSSTH